MFSGDWVRALCSGRKLVICRKEILLSAVELYDLMRREEVDCAEFVPVVLRNLETYDIPYRSLVARGVDGLLVAGKCISATHEGSREKASQGEEKSASEFSYNKKRARFFSTRSPFSSKSNSLSPARQI